jgi:hypothetical protein
MSYLIYARRLIDTVLRSNVWQFKNVRGVLHNEIATLCLLNLVHFTYDVKIIAMNGSKA